MLEPGLSAFPRGKRAGGGSLDQEGTLDVCKNAPRRRKLISLREIPLVERFIAARTLASQDPDDTRGPHPRGLLKRRLLKDFHESLKYLRRHLGGSRGRSRRLAGDLRGYSRQDAVHKYRGACNREEKPLQDRYIHMYTRDPQSAPAAAAAAAFVQTRAISRTHEFQAKIIRRGDT